jgi:murein DD-endopeptidase MepM/ murein hydrolase activator NlpD
MKKLLFALLVCSVAVPAAAEDFAYQPAGQLVAGSGTGRADDKVYVPGMRFPIEAAPVFLNSQVWGVGGFSGPSGGQCDTRNYSYPWYDNYCESRRWDMPLCPSGNGHQGQDMRPATCDDNVHWAVAAEDGQITSIGSYSVYLVSDGGTQHRYLHMDPASVQVSRGQRVSKGDRLGRVSNAFGGTPTTIHLHYDINQFVGELGQSVYVPTYWSLIRSYETLIGQEAEPCDVIPADGGIVDDYGPCFTPFGNPRFWREVEGDGVEGRFHWTNAWVNDTPGNWARWNLHFEQAGEYRVEVNVVPPYNRSTQTRYTIAHGEDETTLTIDQSAHDDWVNLGEFTFAEGGAQSVSVYDNTGESGDDLHITADAVRITPVGTDPTDPGTTENNDTGNGGTQSGTNVDPGTDTGGGTGGTGGTGGENPGTDDPGVDGSTASASSSSCSAAAGPAGLAPLLFFLGMVRLRRRFGRAA